MAEHNPSGRASLAIAVSLLLLMASIYSWGCERSRPPEAEPGKAEEGEKGEAEAETLTLTLYFRHGAGGDTLAREEREVSGVTDVYRAAMEELIAGPAPGSQLQAVLPRTVKVIDIGAAEGVCTVNLSKEILTDAGQVGSSASGEVLALAAIANTLTELEGVTKVKLLIEGKQSGMVEGRFVEDFWGHVGLPEYLERNEGVVR